MGSRDSGDFNLFPEEVLRAAARHRLAAKDLDWHVETNHAWRSRADYPDAVEQAALCMLDGGCEPGGSSGRR